MFFKVLVDGSITPRQIYRLGEFRVSRKSGVLTLAIIILEFQAANTKSGHMVNQFLSIQSLDWSMNLSFSTTVFKPLLTKLPAFYRWLLKVHDLPNGPVF
jgi:hypothetical protein